MLICNDSLRIWPAVYRIEISFDITESFFNDANHVHPSCKGEHYVLTTQTYICQVSCIAAMNVTHFGLWKDARSPLGLPS